ncbi:MAG: hypothetical protein U0176_07925 [Bacteroidia bacterium]
MKIQAIHPKIGQLLGAAAFNDVPGIALVFEDREAVVANGK